MIAGQLPSSTAFNRISKNPEHFFPSALIFVLGLTIGNYVFKQ